jgi:hypothetical protein
MSQQSFLKNLFVRSARWGAYETIIFNGILAAHTTFLFMAIPGYSYGIIGIVFSLVYTMVALTTMGNDIATATIIGTTPTRNTLRHALISHIVQAIFMALLCMLFIGWYCPKIKADILLLAVGILLACAEISKKIIKSLMIATHQFELVAHIEIVSILMYVSITWTLYFFYRTSITPVLLVVPLAFCSCIASGIMGNALHIYYTQAPTEPVHTFCWYDTLTLKGRAAMMCIVNLLFSGNVLVPLSALFSGATFAGGLKFSSSIIQNVVIIAERTFGVTSSLVFSQTKDAHATDHALKLIGAIIIPTLLLSSVLLYGALHWFMVYKELQHLIPTMRLYCIIQLCGVYASLSERFFFAKRTNNLIYGHILIIVASCIAAFSGICTEYTTILMLFALIRGAFLLSIMYCAYHTQHDSASIQIVPTQ